MLALSVCPSSLPASCWQQAACLGVKWCCGTEQQFGAVPLAGWPWHQVSTRIDNSLMLGAGG